ncbi:hypothetical protein [Helicobacter acinonychis]|uniref:hypothetical protein n=1 Tax=Helicobacter acinonychis TaxID=212 RepID=UPI001F457F3A
MYSRILADQQEFDFQDQGACGERSIKLGFQRRFVALWLTPAMVMALRFSKTP